MYLAVAAALAALPEADQEPPDYVRTPTGIVKREQSVVVDRPDLLPLLGNCAALRVPLSAAPAVARMLGLRLASAVAAFDIVSREPLQVRDADGAPQTVSWFGELHDGTPTAKPAPSPGPVAAGPSDTRWLLSYATPSVAKPWPPKRNWTRTRA